jgi:hypothetical protein
VTDLLVFAPVSDLAGGLGTEGVTTSVFCSHAPRSAALAKMQTNLFIVMMVFYFAARCQPPGKTADYGSEVKGWDSSWS